MTKGEKKVRNYIIIGILLLVAFGGVYRWTSEVVNPEKAVTNYENFYLMYDQADQICNDIRVMQGADSISGGFTKNERIMGLENKMNDVIKDYNYQSKAWTRNMWKADDLPHTIKRSDFNCK